MNREQIIGLVIKLEGGLANLKGDPGGWTKFGITQRTLDSLQHKALPVKLPVGVAALSEDMAYVVYRSVQWQEIHGDQLPPAIACLMLNCDVNSGEPVAVHLLQQAVGVPVDGILGDGTVRAVNTWKSRYMPDQTLAEELCAHMAVRYAQLNAVEGQFELGWFRRLFRVYTLTVSS